VAVQLREVASEDLQPIPQLRCILRGQGQQLGRLGLQTLAHLAAVGGEAIVQRHLAGALGRRGRLLPAPLERAELLVGPLQQVPHEQGDPVARLRDPGGRPLGR